MRHTFTVNSIFGGHQPSSFFGTKDQFLQSIGIDPDVPLTDSASDVYPAGAIRPVAYSAFSGSAIDAAPIAIITTPKTSLVYVVLANGKLISYTSALAGETLIGQVSGSVARGAFYYNNYIYIIKPTDVSRYGPLDGAAALTNNVWTGATLGSLTALTDTSYPTTLLSLGYLNHWGITHVDNAAYFLDFLNGVGMVHKIKTTRSAAEGDTNDGSAYNALDLPFNYIPITIASFGNDIAVAACLTSNTSIVQGMARLFLWDTTSASFYRAIPLPDPICSVLLYINGILYGISGDLVKGHRLWRYVGGDAVETLAHIPQGGPPMQGAADYCGSRIVWATYTTYPYNSSGIMAYGSKSDLFPRGLHHIAINTFT